MIGRRIAYREDGRICGRPATRLDGQRGDGGADVDARPGHRLLARLPERERRRHSPGLAAGAAAGDAEVSLLQAGFLDKRLMPAWIGWQAG